MTELTNTQQINQINQIDTTSDVAGGAAVSASYILSDVPATCEVSEAVGVDSVAVANAASSQTSIPVTMVEKEESSNYIASDVNDGLSMNSMEEIFNSNSYIDPSDPAVQFIIETLKDNGIITDSMTADEVAMAIHGYVIANFSYQPEVTGDNWLTASQTIANGGGDCEDLANLEASLLYAAFIDRGMSIEEANSKVNAVVVYDASAMIGHVYVQYTSADGSVKFLNPAAYGICDSIKSTQRVLFTYNAGGVSVTAGEFDCSGLITADSTMDIVSANLDLIIQNEETLKELAWEMLKANMALEIKNAELTMQIEWEKYNDLTQFNPNLKALAEDIFSKLGNSYSDIEALKAYFKQRYAAFIENYPYYMDFDDLTVNSSAPKDLTLYDVMDPYGPKVEPTPGYGFSVITDADGNPIRVDANDDEIVDLVPYQFGSPIRDLIEAIRSYQAWFNAKKIYDETKAQFITFFVPEVQDPDYVDSDGYEDEYTAALNEELDKVLIAPHTTKWGIVNDTDYYMINWDAPIFTDLRNTLERIKGHLLAFAIIYEAKRDMRKLVEDELSGEDGGYKGMNISKLFVTRTNWAMKYRDELIQNVMDTQKTLNDNITRQREEAIRNEYNRRSSEMYATGHARDELDNLQLEIDMTENENAMYRDLNAVYDQQRRVEEQNAAGANRLLTQIQTGANTSSDPFITAMNVLDTEIGECLTNLDFSYITRQTTSTDDDDYTVADQYREMNWEYIRGKRDDLNNAISIRRAVLAAKQALSDIRGLTHQEMTGVSGRQARTDVAAGMLEQEAKEILAWFDNVISATEAVVKLRNQKRYLELVIKANEKLIQELHAAMDDLRYARHLQNLATALSVLGLVATLAGLGVAGVALSLGAMAASSGAAYYTARGRLTAAAARTARQEALMKAEIVPTVDPYAPGSGTVVADTAIPGDTDDPTRSSIQSAFHAQSAAENELAGMTMRNYISDIGRGYARTSVFDSLKFALADQKISTYHTIILISESARKAVAEMRNLVHQEMTGIGGRSPSNMTNYTIEAARGQQSYISNYLYKELADRNQANVARYEAERKWYIAQQYEAQARVAFTWSWIPIIGAWFSNSRTNTADLEFQLEMAKETSHWRWESSSRLENSLLNDLINKGTADIGGGDKAVDYAKAAKTRETLANSFIVESTKASINKMLRQLRSLVHMEMTGVGSADGTSVAEEANMIRFQTAMKAVNLITNYLSQKAQIYNKAEEARKDVDSLNTQLNNIRNATTTGTIAAIVTIIACAVFTRGLSSWMALLNTLQLASTVANAIFSAFAAKNARIRYQAMLNKLQENDVNNKVRAYLRTLETIRTSNANSIEDRLETLEKQCLDEITEDLYQNLGSGYIGVNRGLSSRYKNFLEKLYRGERTKSTVKDAMRELRNQVHEIMSGISGIGEGAVKEVLQIKEAEIKARIDDMFSVLETAAERMNQLNDLQKEVIKAEIAAKLATTMAVIQCVMAVIAVVQAFSPARLNMAKAEGVRADAIDNCKSSTNNLHSNWTSDNVNALNDSYARLNEANSALTSAQSAWNMEQASGLFLTMNALSLVQGVVSLAVSLYFNHLQKDKLENYDHQAENNVSASGITGKGISKNAKTSRVVAANPIAGDTMENLMDMAAASDEQTGQMELESRRNQYELKHEQIYADYKHKKEGIWYDFMMNKLVSIIKGAVDMFQKKDEAVESYMKQEGVKNAISTLNVDGKNRVKETAANLVELANQPTSTEFVKKARMIQGQITVSRLAAMAAKINEALPPSNSTNASAYLSMLESVSADVTDIERMLGSRLEEMPDVKEQLEQLKAALKEKIAKCKEEIAAKKEVEKKGSEATKVVAGFNKAKEEKKKQLIEEFTQTEQMIAELEMYGKNGATKDTVDKVKNRLITHLIKASAEYEDTRDMSSIAEGSHKALIGEAAAYDAEIKKLKHEISCLTDKIREVSKSVSSQPALSKESPLPGLGLSVNKTTDMFSRRGQKGLPVLTF